jgi:hypothetical protein
VALTSGAFQTYNFDRMVVEFTMMNGDAVVRCAVSTSAMDAMDMPFKATTAQREEQFARLRGRIEQRMQEKFRPGEFEGQRAELILRGIDFPA